METEVVLRYRAMSEAKRLEYQRYMKDARSVLLRRKEYEPLTDAQFTREYEAASAAILAFVEGKDGTTEG